MSRPRAGGVSDDISSMRGRERADAMGGDADIIAYDKLKGYKKAIQKKAKNGEFKVVGITPALLTSSKVDGHKVPKGVAEAYEKCLLTKSGTPAGSFVLLVEFIAIMKHFAENDHGGRDRETQKFYESFAGQRGEGKTIFPDDPALAADFDVAVEIELSQLRARQTSENQSLFEPLATKLGISTKEKAFQKFQEDMYKDSSNIAKVNDILLKLQTRGDKNDTLFMNGSKLLSDTLMRALLAFSRGDIMGYKKDFLDTIKAIAPGQLTARDEAVIEAFFTHHAQMITSLTDRYRALYMDLAVNAVALAVKPIVGEVPLPTELVGAVSHTTFGMIDASGMVGASSVAGTAASKVVGLGVKDISRSNAPTPILPVSRGETNSEMYLRWTGEEKQKQVALIAATVVAGVLTGPVGAAVVGVGGGALLYARKFRKAYVGLESIEGIAVADRRAHEEQFCNFCDQLKQDFYQEGRMDGMKSEDMELMVVTRAFLGDEDTEARLAAWRQAHKNDAAASGSTANVFMHLQNNNAEFAPNVASPSSPKAEAPKVKEGKPDKPDKPELDETSTSGVTFHANRR